MPVKGLPKYLIITSIDRHSEEHILTLNAPIITKVACFSRLLKCLRSLYGKLWTQIRLLLVCSGSTLFLSIPNWSVILGIICSRTIQQTTFSEAFFFYWRLKESESLLQLLPGDKNFMPYIFLPEV